MPASGKKYVQNPWSITRTTIFAIAFVCAAVTAAHPDAMEPMAAVRQYVDAFNKGDVEAMAANCAAPTSVLDGLAPHVWQGPTACRDWYRDVLAAGEKEGASGYFVTLGEPRHVDVTGDRAYVVVPTTMTFNVHGKEVMQSGSTFTVALQKLAHGWRISAWAWAKGPQQ
jgi:ketosteroid isomerase-like protein